MKIKNNKFAEVSLTVLCVSIIVLIVSLTYAYFISSVVNPVSETLNVTSGNLRLTFRDNSAEIIPGINGTWNFGDSIEKEVAIENNGIQDLYAKILWDNLINTYLPESLTYTLEVKSSEEDSAYKQVGTTYKNIPQSTTASTQELADHLLVPAGKTNIYKITITLENLPDIDQTADLNATFSTKFILKQGTELLLVDALLSKRNADTISLYTDGVAGEMYTFDHKEAIQTMGWSDAERRDYRYIGATPNNWVKFNGEDWRIIGVFTAETSTGKKEQLVKIIRNESIGNLAWDTGRVNEWPTSSLKTILNDGDYYNRTNTYAGNGLNDTAKNQIETVKWYLGGISGYNDLKGSDYYKFERGVSTCVTTGKCSGQTRSTSTIAKVGLMYPSDYSYTYANGVDSTCYTNGYGCNYGMPANGWLYNRLHQSTISSSASVSDEFAAINGMGYWGNQSEVYNPVFSIRPSVYLKSKIKVISGDGTNSENAYVLLI